MCRGRLHIGAEREEQAEARVTGEGDTKKRPKEDMVALAGCTVEGINYTLECLSCRRTGIRTQGCILFLKI